MACLYDLTKHIKIASNQIEYKHTFAIEINTYLYQIRECRWPKGKQITKQKFSIKKTKVHKVFRVKTIGLTTTY